MPLPRDPAMNFLKDQKTSEMTGPLHQLFQNMDQRGEGDTLEDIIQRTYGQGGATGLQISPRARALYSQLLSYRAPSKGAAAANDARQSANWADTSDVQ